MILGCTRPKYFFSGLPNLLPQKIRLPLISFFSGVNSQLHLGKLRLGKLSRLEAGSVTENVKVDSVTENAEADSAIELQQNCRQTDARTDVVN
jgi:hypothetical protein